MSMGRGAPSVRPRPRSLAKRVAPSEDLVGISITIWWKVYMVVVGVILTQIRLRPPGMVQNW